MAGSPTRSACGGIERALCQINRPQEKHVSSNPRFVIKEEGHVIDTLTLISDTHVRLAQEEGQDQKFLRERLFMGRLLGLIEKLIVNRRPMEKLPTGNLSQPFIEYQP